MTLVVRDDSVFLNREEAVGVIRRTGAIATSPRRCSCRLCRSATRASRRPPARIRRQCGAAPRCSSCASWQPPTTATPMCCRVRCAARASAAFFPIPSDAGEPAEARDARRRPQPVGRKHSGGIRGTRAHDRTDDADRRPGQASFETVPSDLGLMRDLPAVPEDLTPLRLLPPADNTREDPEPVVTSRARARGLCLSSVGPRRARLLRRCAHALPEGVGRGRADAV